MTRHHAKDELPEVPADPRNAECLLRWHERRLKGFRGVDPRTPRQRITARFHLRQRLALARRFLRDLNAARHPDPAQQRRRHLSVVR